ncbi:MAG: ParB/RepB/Spo0J family partition protein [Acidobacteriota bacterium]|nr:ParB/RepB/Spo0J family partition protein [Acidobacteriota bacterium]
MSKRGLPLGLKMRHDSHYVDELTKSSNFIGRTIEISKIEPNPDQPRVEMGDLSELVASIKEKGVLEPLLVKPLSGKWLIIAGERRWRAATIAGLTEVPCIELNVSEQEIAEIALIENLQRKDLTVWEEADAYQALCERFKYTHEDLAKKLSKSRSSVTETLTIASLPLTIRQECISAGISSKAAILKIARKFSEVEMLAEIRGINEKLQEETPRKETKPKSPEIVRDLFDAPTRRDADTTTNLNFPLRIFKLDDENRKFKLEIKFKKLAELNDLEDALMKTMELIKKQIERGQT